MYSLARLPARQTRVIVKLMRNCRITLLLLGLLLAGCSSSGRTFDLNSMMGKVSMGMNEFQVTQALGAPTKIEVVNGVRELRYDGNDGKGFLVVSLKDNVVIDARRR